MENLKSKKMSAGITLIALVVTIIVLLILAGISVQMLTGNNGVLQKAGEAKEKTETGQEKEIIYLAHNSIVLNKNSKGDTSEITGEEYSKAIKSYDEGAKITSDRAKYIVTYSNGHQYYIYKNGKITEYTEKPYAKDELVLTEVGDTIESPYYVNYPSKKANEDDNEKIKCRVLYNDNTYGLQIISVDSLINVTLGKNDSNENLTGDLGSIERAQSSYMRAVTTLNEKAEEYKETIDSTILAEDARCVGSNPLNKNYPDNLDGEEKMNEMYIGTEEYMKEYNGKYFKGDKNYYTDRSRLGKIGGLNILSKDKVTRYWFASRSHGTHASYRYSIWSIIF